jgi:hypothetical protein
MDLASSQRFNDGTAAGFLSLLGPFADNKTCPPTLSTCTLPPTNGLSNPVICRHLEPTKWQTRRNSSSVESSPFIPLYVPPRFRNLNAIQQAVFVLPRIATLAGVRNYSGILEKLTARTETATEQRETLINYRSLSTDCSSANAEYSNCYCNLDGEIHTTGPYYFLVCRLASLSLFR